MTTLYETSTNTDLKLIMEGMLSTREILQLYNPIFKFNILNEKTIKEYMKEYYNLHKYLNIHDQNNT